MSRDAVVFDARHEAYSIQDIADEAMTVGELRNVLRNYDDDDLVILSYDNGYTFGSLHEGEIERKSEDEWED